MTTQSGLANSLVNWLANKTQPRTSAPVALPQEVVHSIWPSAQTLRAINGRLWVSINGLDFILEEGGDLYLPPSSRYPAIISNVSKRTVFYEIR